MHFELYVFIFDILTFW